MILIRAYLYTIYQVTLYLLVIFSREFYPKSYILNVREWIFHEIQIRVDIFLICKIESNSANCKFLDFDILAKIEENGCTRKKIDIRYVMDICVFRLNQLLFQNYWKLSLTILTYFGNMLEANFNQQKFKLKIRCSVNLWGECKHYKPK